MKTKFLLVLFVATVALIPIVTRADQVAGSWTLGADAAVCSTSLNIGVDIANVLKGLGLNDTTTTANPFSGQNFMNNGVISGSASSPVSGVSGACGGYIATMWVPATSGAYFSADYSGGDGVTIGSQNLGSSITIFRSQDCFEVAKGLCTANGADPYGGCTQTDIALCNGQGSSWSSKWNNSATLSCGVPCVGLHLNTPSSPPPSIPPATPVNGSCSSPSVHYICAAGSSANNVPTTSSWTWDCIGQNGGTTASCSEAKPANAVTSSVTVTVAPGLDFYIEPKPPAATSATIASGGSKNLSWASTNADTCTGSINGSSVGAIPTSLSNWNTGALTTKTTYSITCTGPGGSVTKGVVVDMPSINLFFTTP